MTDIRQGLQLLPNPRSHHVILNHLQSPGRIFVSRPVQNVQLRPFPKPTLTTHPEPSSPSSLNPKASTMTLQEVRTLNTNHQSSPTHPLTRAPRTTSLARHHRRRSQRPSLRHQNPFPVQSKRINHLLVLSSRYVSSFHPPLLALPFLPPLFSLPNLPSPIPVLPSLY